jgi:hypothetical protein
MHIENQKTTNHNIYFAVFLIIFSVYVTKLIKKLKYSKILVLSKNHGLISFLQ